MQKQLNETQQLCKTISPTPPAGQFLHHLFIINVLSQNKSLKKQTNLKANLKSTYRTNLHTYLFKLAVSLVASVALSVDHAFLHHTHYGLPSHPF